MNCSMIRLPSKMWMTIWHRRQAACHIVHLERKFTVSIWWTRCKWLVLSHKTCMCKHVIMLYKTHCSNSTDSSLKIWVMWTNSRKVGRLNNDLQVWDPWVEITHNVLHYALFQLWGFKLSCIHGPHWKIYQLAGCIHFYADIKMQY